MKKLIYLIVLALILCLVLTGCSLLSNVGQVPVTEQMKVKPTGNLAGADEVLWHLSADVMPVPPYGSCDILGSASASKLIVNQPNGSVEVAVTGVMNGLDPNTDYTVYLSKSYEPYVLGWNVVGTWVLRLHFGASIYDHDVVIEVQSDGTFEGTGGWPASDDPPYNNPYNETVYGTIDIMTGVIEFHSDYENSYFYDATGTIASDGTMSGNWTGSGQPTYTWESISGQATNNHTGDTWSQGSFKGQQWFQFTTDANGSGSWHVNLKDSDFDNMAETYTLSVWINKSGASILVSDHFAVVVD